MAYTIQHTAVGAFPTWYHLECATTFEQAQRRANSYALDHGGYVCVQDAAGRTVFGTDPAELDRAICSGVNKNFRKETARRAGYCVQ